jgi:ribulose-5-phosphate 4-epimerase/fuculose-1-phosphate aldolase
MSITEQVIREKLARVHRLAARLDWSDPLETHIAARIPNENAILITPGHGYFDAMTAEALVKVGFDGGLSDSSQRVTRQAVGVHLPVYIACPGVECSIHSHNENITAVSSLQCGLLKLNQHALRFVDEVVYLDFGGLATRSEGERISAVLGGRSVAMLRNHGSVVFGSSIEEAVYRQYHLEWVCRIQLKTLSAGSPYSELTDEQALNTKAQFDSYINENLHLGFFDALCRTHGIGQ